MKDKNIAALLALLVGWTGAHRFYLEDAGAGCTYLMFFWAWPLNYLFAFVEGFSFLMMSQNEFDRRYNRPRMSSDVHVTVTTVDPTGVFTGGPTVRTVRVGPPMGRPVEATVRRPRTPGASGKDYASRRPVDSEERERFVLRAAADHGGRLTPSQLALVTQLGLKESKQALDELHGLGACEIEVDANSGALIYVFPELEPEERLTGEEARQVDDELDLR